MIDISRAGFIIDYFFDLREDIALGDVNIPLEAIEGYGIKIDDLDSDELHSWMRDKMESLRETLFSNPFRELPLLAWGIAKSMAWKRRGKFRQIESNGYLPP